MGKKETGSNEKSNDYIKSFNGVKQNPTLKSEIPQERERKKPFPAALLRTQAEVWILNNREN